MTRDWWAFDVAAVACHRRARLARNSKMGQSGQPQKQRSKITNQQKNTTEQHDVADEPAKLRAVGHGENIAECAAKNAHKTRQ